MMLIYAAPLPGVGQLTIANAINCADIMVQAVSYYEFVLNDLADEFGVSYGFLRKHMRTPCNALPLFNHGPDYRKAAKLERLDFFEPRTAGFHIARYLGNMRQQDSRLRRYFGAFNPNYENVVLFGKHDAWDDIAKIREYADSTDREFALVDLTRSGVPKLAGRRMVAQGGDHIDNPENRPQDAIAGLLRLIP